MENNSGVKELKTLREIYIYIYMDRQIDRQRQWHTDRQIVEPKLKNQGRL